jgi:hypothetical protein
MNKSKTISQIFAVLFVLLSDPGFAEGALSRADDAVANILFEYDGADEFASYAVKDRGFIDIIFADNMPNTLYSEILNKLKNQPDIDGVLAGKTGPMCGVFYLGVNRRG